MPKNIISFMNVSSFYTYFGHSYTLVNVYLKFEKGKIFFI